MGSGLPVCPRHSSRSRAIKNELLIVCPLLRESDLHRVFYTTGSDPCQTQKRSMRRFPFAGVQQVGPSSATTPCYPRQHGDRGAFRRHFSTYSSKVEALTKDRAKTPEKEKTPVERQLSSLTGELRRAVTSAQNTALHRHHYRPRPRGPRGGEAPEETNFLGRCPQASNRRTAACRPGDRTRRAGVRHGDDGSSATAGAPPCRPPRNKAAPSIPKKDKMYDLWPFPRGATCRESWRGP